MGGFQIYILVTAAMIVLGLWWDFRRERRRLEFQLEQLQQLVQMLDELNRQPSRAPGQISRKAENEDDHIL